MADIEQKAQERENDQPPDQSSHHHADVVPASGLAGRSAAFIQRQSMGLILLDCFLLAGMIDSDRLPTIAILLG